MPDNKKGFDPKQVLKAVTTAVKEYGKIQGERNKIQAELISNEMEKRQNWLWKIKEAQAKPEAQAQMRMGQQFQQQAPGATSPFQPHIRRSKTGAFEQYNPSGDVALLGYLRKKKKANKDWDEEDEAKLTSLEGKVFGTKGTAYQQKADIQKKEVLEILRQGSFQDKEGNINELGSKEAATNYIMQNYDVDIDDPDIQQSLGQYKEREEGLIEPSWFERTFGGQQYPRKEKYGFTYEQREDGKWHKIEE